MLSRAACKGAIPQATCFSQPSGEAVALFELLLVTVARQATGQAVCVGDCDSSGHQPLGKGLA